MSIAGQHPRPPNVPLLRASWSLLDGVRGVVKGIWAMLRALQAVLKSIWAVLRAFWSLSDGIWGFFRASWGMLDDGRMSPPGKCLMALFKVLLACRFWVIQE